MALPTAVDRYSPSWPTYRGGVLLCTLLLIIVDKLLHLHAVAGHRDGVLLADVPVLQDVVVDLGGGGDRRDV